MGIVEGALQGVGSILVLVVVLGLLKPRDGSPFGAVGWMVVGLVFAGLYVAGSALLLATNVWMGWWGAPFRDGVAVGINSIVVCAAVVGAYELLRGAASFDRILGLHPLNEVPPSAARLQMVLLLAVVVALLASFRE